MDEYVDDARARHLEQPSAVPSQKRGPLQSPIYNPGSKGRCGNPCLEEIADSVGRDGLFAQGKVFPANPSLGCIGFVQTLGVVSIAATGSAANATATLATLSVSEGYTGILRYISFQVIPGGNFADITYTITSGNQADPQFAKQPFYGQTMADLIEYYKEIEAGKSVNLITYNSGASALQLAGKLIGFLRPNGY